MTVATALSLISAVLAIARSLIQWAEQNKWMEAGAAQAALQGLREADDAIAKARQARQDVRNSIARDPDGVLRDDDGFKRKD